MTQKTKNRNKQSLKTVYYRLFLFFIAAPILIVLIVALLLLNQQFKKQAMENIRRAQETIITELQSDIDTVSMRLSHLVYTNNNQILTYAAGTDTSANKDRYEFGQKLSQAANMALEPLKDIIEVAFYMKDGKVTYIKNGINRSQKAIEETAWYQEALQKPNTVCVGSYDTLSMNELFKGGKKDSFILVFALSPNITTDRSEKIEVIAFYQSTDVGERIKSYNSTYLSGKNRLGITQVTDQKGALVFSTEEESDFSSSSYIKISTPMNFNHTTWYIDSYITTADLTRDYRTVAIFVLCAAVVVFALVGYYSRYFLKSIVKPIEEMSFGLRQVEEGELEIHIAPVGQYEIRNMIHLFNSMVRRLKVLIDEYEEKVKSIETTPKDYFEAMVKGKLEPSEVNRTSVDFFRDTYTILGFYIEEDGTKKSETDCTQKLSYSFERNPRFTSRCVLYAETPEFFFVFYRITEDNYTSPVIHMAEELQKSAEKEFGVEITVCIGTETMGYQEFDTQIEEIRRKMCLRHLKGANAIINLSKSGHGEDTLIETAEQYAKLASALYTADEKNLVQEKEKLFEYFSDPSTEIVNLHVYAVILAIANRFSADHGNFYEVFGQKYNYVERISRMEDTRTLKLWLTNYFAWIMDYSASKLNVSETDVIVKAKRYIADNYEDAELSLTKVAEYVGLNEKYFTNRFTKETGETFTAYLTSLRMQKARELLKTTNFKVYEIAEMIGYHNVEHFNRTFKKMNAISPVQFRKSGNDENKPI